MNSLDQFKEHGAESLTDLQMVATLIGESEARNIFNTYDSLATISRQGWEQIKHETFISGKAAQKTEIISALSRRISEAQVDYSAQLTAPDDAAGYLMPKLNHLTNEHFVVVFLNNAKQVMGCTKISQGGKTATIVDPAAVLKAAILKEASSILIAHNHPSGNLTPSNGDKQLTERIAKAGKMLSIPVDDHLIIANGEYVSFRSKGLIN